MNNIRLTVRGLFSTNNSEPFSWVLEHGKAYLVSSARGLAAAELLENLTGEKGGLGLSVEYFGLDGRKLRSVKGRAGTLPAPGAEIFVGTTIGEQLEFFARGDYPQLLEQSGLDQLFGFDFAGRTECSVWDLSPGESRCLLLVSQALSIPDLWLLSSPLSGLDGKRSNAVKEFIGSICDMGGTVVAFQEESLELIGCCSELLVLEEESGAVSFSGTGQAAATYLAEQMGLLQWAEEALLNTCKGIE